MTDKKHIDRLFQEKFKNFEATPDAEVWDNIHNALHQDKRKRRVIPLWWFAAGTAAVLVLLFTVGNSVFNKNGLGTPEIQTVGTETIQDSDESTKTVGVDKMNEHSSDIENEHSSDIENTEQSEPTDRNSKTDNSKNIRIDKNKTATQIAHQNTVKNTTDSPNNQDKAHVFQNDKRNISDVKEESVAKNTSNLPELNPDKKALEADAIQNNTYLEIEKNQSQIAKTTDENQSKDAELLIENNEWIILNKKDESIEEAIAKANLIDEEEKEEQPNRWNISPNVAPVYFNSLGSGSSIDNQFVNNGKSEVNMSYGLSGSYALNDKIKIRAGINKVNLGYSTGGVITVKDVNSSNISIGNSQLKNINFNAQGRNDLYMSSPMTNSRPEAAVPQFVASSIKGTLEQQFGYIEVPLEIEYSIINNQFGLNLIGGFSTLFLDNNEIYSVLENKRSLLGEANNMNSTSYSANFGLGFNYNISPRLKLNLEPMFKYQINTFTNTSGDFRPYFIGVYSGFSFKF